MPGHDQETINSVNGPEPQDMKAVSQERERDSPPEQTEIQAYIIFPSYFPTIYLAKSTVSRARHFGNGMSLKSAYGT